MFGLKVSLKRHGLLAALPIAAAALSICGATAALAGPKVTELWQFTGTGGNGDGYFPVAGVVADSQGRLYGTTFDGGANASGTVYRLTPPLAGQTQWTEEILHSFDKTDGESPMSPVTLGADGSIYGTTYEGGTHGQGVAFKLANAPGFPITILHNFDVAHGAYPMAGLTFGSDGLLYGATPADANTPYPAAGTVFSLSPEGDHVEYKAFAPFGRLTPGGGPSNLTRILPGPAAPATDFIGTTNPGPIGLTGPFTAFLLRTMNGVATSASIAYTFGVAPGDVTDPIGAPIQGSGALHNLFFGCALYGGANDVGGVYQLTPKGNGTYSEKVLFSFGRPSRTDPTSKCSVVQVDTTGTLYGTTDGGAGVLFALYPPTTAGGQWTEADLTEFNTYITGTMPEGALLRIGDTLYQTFEYPSGSVVQITP